MFREHEELFTETSWLAGLVGPGDRSRGGVITRSPTAARRRDLDRLAHIRQVVAYTAEQMPTQDQFLRRSGSTSEVALRRAS